MTEPVGEQTEAGSGEDRGKEHPAVGYSRFPQGEPFRVLEILDGIGRAERKKYGGEEHVQCQDVPVGPIEAEEFAPSQSRGPPRPARSDAGLIAPVQPIKQRRRGEAQHGDGSAESQRRLPAAVIERSRPRR